MATVTPQTKKPIKRANIPLAEVGLSNRSRLLQEKNEVLMKKIQERILTYRSVK